VRWPQNGATQTIARDIGEISFDRLSLGNLNFVKVILQNTKGAALQKIAIGRNQAVLAELKKGYPGRRGQLHIVTGRLFQKQTSEGEEGISKRTRLDLRDDTFKCGGAWQKL